MSDIEATRAVRALLAAHRVGIGTARCVCGEDFGTDASLEELLQSHDEHQARIIVAWMKLP